MPHPAHARAATAAATLLALAGSAAAQPTIVDLGALPSAGHANATALSADGSTVVGSASVGNALRAVRWTQGSGLQNLGTPSPWLSSAFAAASTDASALAGSVNDLGFSSRAFRWTAAGYQVLGTLPGDTLSFGRAISGDGTTVVGLSAGPAGNRAFRWTAAQGITALAPLPGGILAEAVGLNADGSVAVGSGDNGSDIRAIRWVTGQPPQNLGLPPGATAAFATAVNADGTVVVGFAQYPGFIDRAFRWSPSTGMIDLGTTPGSEETLAEAVSATGAAIVGRDKSAAFFWTKTLGMARLNTVVAGLGTPLNGWDFQDAVGISADATAIAGTGTLNGQPRSFLIRNLPRSFTCPANCDASTIAPVLNALDFTCFLNRYRQASALSPAQQVAAYVNCDGSTAQPAVNASDFSCFLNRFLAGCP